MKSPFDAINYLIDKRKRSVTKWNRSQKGKHQAALYHGNGLISTGSNNEYEHAEMAAIRHNHSHHRNLTLVVVRLAQGLKGGNSRPCLHCLKGIADNGNIKEIIYTNSDGSYTRTTINKMIAEGHQHISSGNCIEEICCSEEDDEKAKNI